MLAGFLLGIVHDRRLMREAQVNLAIRWFVGYGLHEPLPDHSSLTRIRQRWGAERFRRIFERTVQACMAAKIAKGEIVHVDASLIRADVELGEPRRPPCRRRRRGERRGETAERDSRKTGKFKKVCVTDPDATMATNGRNRRLEPSYKQHAVVDDAFGVVLDVEVTTGEVNEGQVVLERIDAAAATTGAPIRTVTADAGYAYAKVYGGLERRGIEAVIPAKAEPIRSPVPLRRFRYDATHDILKCPRGKILRPTRPVKHGRFFYARAATAALRSGRALPVEGAGQQGGRGRRRLSGAAARPPTARALDRRGSAALPAPPLALGGLPRRGEDLARPRPRRPARPPRTCASRPS